MFSSRRIVPLTLATLLACQGDPIADPSPTDTDSDGELATTTGTTGGGTQGPTSGDPTTTGGTGEPTSDGSTSAAVTGDTTTADDSTGGDTTGAPDPSCGDGHTDPGEACDNGAENGDDQACTADCTINVCGDGKQGPGEGCDDGNVLDDDECSAKCSLPDCGDGHVGVGEACDDGNLDDSDECTAACTPAACGDSFTQPSNSEECDDGAGNNAAAACTPECLNAVCGDGYVLEDIEECDDGAQNGDDQSCTAACTINICGDGKRGPGEACDDGNLVDDDGCSAACVAPPEATTLKLKFSQIKRFDFSWAAATGATFYRLLESPTKDAPYVQLGADILDEKLSLIMPLHLRYGARYVLQACNGGGCTASPPLDVVDHMAGAVGYFKASNTQANDAFARCSLAADGRTLAVGANDEDSAATGIDGDQTDNSAAIAGAAYVFAEAGGVWTQQAYVKASNTAAQDFFGVHVALSGDGDTLAVGAHGEDSAASGVDGDQANNAASGAGAVYLYERVGQTWSQKHYIKAFNPESGDNFGVKVGLSADGDTLVVSAVGEDGGSPGVGGNQADNSASGSGAVYVFVRTADTWTQQAYVKASNPDAGDAFGQALALSGDGKTLAVGAYAEDSAATGIDGDQASNAATSAGAVYVFRSVGGAWSQQAYVKAANAEANDMFGQNITLAADGNTLAVGAHLEDSAAVGVGGDPSSNASSASGAAYVFAYGNGAWSQQAYLKASNAAAGGNFGLIPSLSASGDLLAVSAPNEPSGAIGVDGNQFNDVVPLSGAVYVFERKQGAWSQRAYVKPSNPGTFDQWGSAAVQLSGDGRVLAVSTAGEDSAATGIGGKQSDNTASNAGAVYLY